MYERGGVYDGVRIVYSDDWQWQSPYVIGTGPFLTGLAAHLLTNQSIVDLPPEALQNVLPRVTPGKAATMAPGAEPLSIESLLQKQKEEREAAARVSTQSSPLPYRHLMPF